MFVQALRDPADADHRSALTMWTLQRRLVFARVALFIVATFFGLGSLATSGFATAGCAAFAFAFTAASQILERYFYFTAVIALRMPGGVFA